MNMKKNIIYIILLLGIIACGGDSAGEGGPQVNKDYLSVPPSLELLSEGQTVDLKINSNCNWSITEDADWLTVTPMSGSNEQTVIVSASKNSSGSDRMAVLTVQGGTLAPRRVTVTQKKADETPVQLYMSVNATSLEFSKAGESKSFIINSNTSWNITCPEWCSLSTKSGNSNATITVTAVKNDKTESRSGQITLKGNGVDDVTITVSQEAGDKNTNQPNPDDNQPPGW